MRIVCLILAVILSIDWFYALYHEIQFFRIANTPKKQWKYDKNRNSRYLYYFRMGSYVCVIPQRFVI